MKSPRSLSFILACVVGFSIMSCAGGPAPKPSSADAVSTAEKPQVPPKEPPAAAAPEPAPKEAQPKNPAQENPDSSAVSRQPITVSKEVYSKTFEAVEKVINELNTIISNGNFRAWTSYLTQQYVQEMSKPSTLQALSRSPILKRNNIVLTSLEDYFSHVVVPSRSNARLDDLVFLDENTVEAVMVVRGQRVILYQLEKRDGKWKIGLF